MSEIVPEYEGKAKQMLPGADASTMVQRFKDSATAFNGVKKEEFPGKGRLNNAISTRIFEALEEAGDACRAGRLDKDPLVRGQPLLGFEDFVVGHDVDAPAGLAHGGIRALPAGRVSDPDRGGDGVGIDRMAMENRGGTGGLKAGHFWKDR